MTPICSEHAALLKRIARHPEDRHCRKAYADWLQERGEIAWLIVANYHPYTWPIQYLPESDLRVEYAYNGGASYGDRFYGVPWLEGKVLIGPYRNFKVGFRWILEAFANGEAK